MSGDAAAQAKARGHYESSGFILLLLLCTLLTAWQFFGCMQEGRCSPAEDFEVFYTPAHAMAAGNPASPYPLAKARAWVAAPDDNGTFHYSLYPPHSLMLFYPLGLLSQRNALLVWDTLQLVLLIAACRTAYVRRLAGSGLVTFAILFPFALVNLLAGQVGMLCASLFVFTLAWRNSRPVFSALALAFLTLKPQLALMLPILLLLERNVKVLLLAGLFTLLLTGGSLLMFGLPVWGDYLKLLALSPEILNIAPPQLLKVSLSPALALRMTGLPAGSALLAQTMLSFIVIALLAKAFPRAGEDEKLMIVAAATFLFSPYSFHYDAVLLAFACMMLLRQWREGRVTAPGRIALIMLAFIPIVLIKLQAMHIPYGALAILAGFYAACAKPRHAEPT